MVERRNARSAVIRTVLLLFMTAAAASLLLSCGSDSHSISPDAGGMAQGTPHVYVSTFPYVYVVPQPPAPPPAPPSTVGYSVATNGELTPIPGPLPVLGAAAISGNYLFAVGSDGPHLESYLIGDDGSLTKIQSLNVEDIYNHLLVNHSGTNLYLQIENENGVAYRSYRIDQVSGKLSVESTTNFSFDTAWLYALSSDDHYAYGGYAYVGYSPPWSSTETGYCHLAYFATGPDGALSPNQTELPAMSAPSGQTFCPWALQADNTGHIAAAIQGNAGYLDFPERLTSFTINADGSLSSTSTAENMATPSMGISSISLSPSGTLLAVGGSTGIQIFNFYGAAPITPNSSIFTVPPTNGGAQWAFAWDHHEHLYALEIEVDLSKNKLYVFTVTSKSFVQAPGSPYTIPDADALMVQP